MRAKEELGQRIDGQRGGMDDEEKKEKASQQHRQMERESVALRHSAAATD